MLIGICGANDVGKSTLARRAIAELGAKAYAFADALKREVAPRVPFPHSELGWNGEDWTGPKSERGRTALKLWGASRREADSNHWIKQLAAALHREGRLFGKATSLSVIQDVRHENEIFWIRHHDGVVLFLGPETPAPDNHPSETEWRRWARGKYLTRQAAWEQIAYASATGSPCPDA